VPAKGRILYNSCQPLQSFFLTLALWMTFREASQFFLKYMARFIQDFRIWRSVHKQFTSDERIPYMLALRDFGDLLCVSHPKPFDSVLYDGSNRNSFEPKIGAYNYAQFPYLQWFIIFQ